MIEPFLIKPFIALILISISCSLLGVFTLWKKLVYFGDALSHSILLGLVCGSVFGVGQIISLTIFAIIFSFLVSFNLKNRYFSKDTIIAISAYFSISLAIILNEIFLKDFNFMTYIFGDILTVGSQEIQIFAVIAVVTILFVIFTFKRILLININQDLAKIEGLKCELWNLIFLILLALTIALSVRIVGVFLMTALLILPAAIARIFSASAKVMIFLSLMIAMLAAPISFEVANKYDLNISSVLIAILSVIFMFSLSIKKFNFGTK